MNYDVLMSEEGDLFFLNHDLVPTESIRQAILIRLRWFFNEWQYGPQYGVDYFGKVFIKNPNRTIVLSMIAQQIRSVEGVKSVTDLALQINQKTRAAIISFKVTTVDRETYDMEVDVLTLLNKRVTLVYSEENGHMVVRPSEGAGKGYFYIMGGDLIYEQVRPEGLQDAVTYELVDGELIETRY